MNKEGIRASELSRLVEGEFSGEIDPVIRELADLDTAGDAQIAFISGKGMAGLAEKSRAAVLIVTRDFAKMERSLIRVDDPVLAATVIQQRLLFKPFKATGVHASAVIGYECSIPTEVDVAPRVCIGDRVRLGERVRIGAGCVIGDDVTIGEDTVLYPNVSVLEHSLIGARVIIHSGTVIGSDGFGYAHDRRGRHLKRLHIGHVQIDDDVEIGANSCVDRATFGRTWIKRGTKIDNLVQVAHNVIIGEDSILVSQAGISGSTILGDGVVMGGKSAVSGHLRIGNRVTIAAKAGVTSNIEDGTVVAGFPAIPHKLWLRAVTAIPRLPDLLKELRELRRRLAELTDSGNKLKK